MKTLKIIALVFAGFAALLLILLLSLIRPDIPVERLMESYTDETSQFLDIDGMQVHVKDEGEGPVLLLLHGMFASLHTWDPWAEELNEEFRLVRVDLPGFGITGPHPEGDYSLRASMYVLESIRKELGIEKWTLIGNSMGGGLALSYAQLYPEHTENVVLFNGGRLLTSTSAPGESNGPEERTVSARVDTVEVRDAEETNQSATVSGNRQSLVLRALGSPALRKALSVLTPKFIIERSLKEVYGDPDRLQTEAVTRYYELLRREGNRQAYLSRREMQPRRDGNLPDLPDPVNINDSGVPVLIIWGRLDSWIPVSVGYRLHEAIAHSQLIIYEDLGHVPMEEDPERTIAAVKEYLIRGD
ncbi:MAG: alpha/beta hydrolase [Balneolaceae bacterium]|nr:MAG: alpha/beta hydrolase [Balneolaceae bacterium]